MMTEPLWSDIVIERVSQLCGDRSIPYGYAIGQREDLVDLLRSAAEKKLAVTDSPTAIYAALRSEADMDKLDPEKAQSFFYKLNWGLTVQELLEDLKNRILEYKNPFPRIPADIQSTDEMLGINDAVDPHAPVDTY